MTTKKHLFATGAGKLVYPWLNRPDTAFDAEGVYHTKLTLPAEEALTLVAQLTAERDEFAAEQAKKTGKKPRLAQLPWEINDDSTVTFKFKLKASGVNRATGESFTQKPSVIGPDGEGTDRIVGNGSLGKVAFIPVPFYNASLGVGLTLRLRAVKVLEFAAVGAANVFGDESGEGEHTPSGSASASDAVDF